MRHAHRIHTSVSHAAGHPASHVGKAAPSIAVLTLVLALAGCAVGPDYERPQSTLPATFAPGAEAAADATATATNAVAKDWWTLFRDNTLNDLVNRALAHNHDLLAAVARVEEAEGLARQANAAFYPQVDLEAGSSRTEVSKKTATWSSSSPHLVDSRTAGLSTSFEIDLWGRLRRADEAARAQVLASRYARDTVELSVAGLVTTGYLTLRAADASLALSESTLALRAKSLDIVRSRLDAGSASPIELYQAEGSVAAVEAQIASLRRQRALAANQLALLTGDPALAIVGGDLRQLPTPPVPPTGLPSALLEARPDIRQAEETLVSANAEIGVAKAALYPNLSLTGTFGSASKALGDLFTGGAGTWSLGAAALMPLFDAGRNAALIDQASARQKQALVAYQQAVQTAFKEVNDALVSLSENAAGEAAQDKSVAAAQKTLELAQIRYEAGYSGFLDVLDAQRSANETLLASVSARQARLNSAVDLFKALGGGWTDEYRTNAALATSAPVRQ